MSHRSFDRFSALLVMILVAAYFISKYEEAFILIGIVALCIFLYSKVIKIHDKTKSGEHESFYDIMKSHAKDDEQTWK